jgi:hypothetical protein
MKHKHHRRHMDICDDCTTLTTTTWVLYEPETTTSTKVVFTTKMVVIDASETTTITYTTTDDSDATPAANPKYVRRQVEDSVDSDDKGTSTLMTPATTASTDCPVIEIETWVPYAPGQFFMGDDENTSSSTKATKKYRQAPTGSSAPVDPPTLSVPVPSVVPTTAPASTNVPAATATAAVASDPAPAPAPASVSNGGLYAMTYTGYTSNGGCASADSVLADLQDIKSKGFPRIRMYGVDCNQLSTVADQAVSLGFTLTLGVYLDDTGTVRGASDLSTMIAWGHWDNVEIINIGMSTLVSFF